ncbi:DEAD-box ATP-dependent RNA helicase 51 [Vitis vinifera]|uniref:ATP-dependent RNA helicase n=1 Tax=Vitis vinifera TaxID=29760 RepID=A0A438FAX0_VITVI|nr:DEAD-box ATP-dependent RNA helicase 51 [Vitis vinifera]
MLFSQPSTKKVEDLARLSFQTTPVYIDVDDGRTKVTNKGLQRGYCVVPSAKESVLLYSFLKKNLTKKVDCLDIHGKQKQQKRTSTFFDFCKVEKGILLCIDVAVRGLGIPDVDWMRQKEPPGMRGSACVEVMTTLHGSAPSLRRRAEGCIPPEGMIASARDILKSTHIHLEPP